ncbi:hypothetical protein [Halosimplex pelagicum]|uniref:DUF8013 domain-containing protein n=1 Tax=Halosimplex pelagicum TaxID=869886 RepID=A0A7D5PEN9_9EURY|nr:hypothetical protein [Halosimplex pelagicum]QLH84798.1 hypothetical protein HZS54_25605 [Halosimplex pelagicum]
MSSPDESTDVSIDSIPVDIESTGSETVTPDDVPDEIESLTLALASESPPTNPLVVLKAARWWYIHGKGGADPAFQWAIEWTRHLATDTPGDTERFDAFLDYLVTVGFAQKPSDLR